MKTKLTPLPGQNKKPQDPFLQLALPMGFLASVHGVMSLTLAYVSNQRLQGALIALGTVLIAGLFYKAYKGAKK